MLFLIAEYELPLTLVAFCAYKINLFFMASSIKTGKNNPPPSVMLLLYFKRATSRLLESPSPTERDVLYE